ncbi:MAG: glucosamine-6-phosphate deaminase [Acidobacteria bacterium]|nr:glucosamine-6-phosphate deaminase [Acidobacteriota bacterium]
MNVQVFSDKRSLAKAAAGEAGREIRNAIAQRGWARIVGATGASQFEFLEELTKISGIDWKKVEMFHLDEYLDMPETHPASFRKYLRERLIDKVGITKAHLLDGQRDPAELIPEITAEIRRAPIDVAFVGIGENGHLAFNDPPADFETHAAYMVVDLDEACRRQQFSEGWFKSLDEVPRRALSMTVHQVLEARKIIVVVPDARKAHAVAKCFQGKVSSMAPASILRTHPNAFLYLDKDSASLLKPELVDALKA